MPQRIEKLKATLRELEAEMASVPAPELDAEARALLERTVTELQAALETQPEELEPQSLADRLTESAESFRISHPTLFSVLNRTADALSRIGI
jgi:hypothetical protein